MTGTDNRDAVSTLIKRAKEAKTSDEAQKFAQAALNTANAMRSLDEILGE